jgi:hypothetical protein
MQLNFGRSSPDLRSSLVFLLSTAHYWISGVWKYPDKTHPSASGMNHPVGGPLAWEAQSQLECCKNASSISESHGLPSGNHIRMQIPRVGDQCC